jgi:hypothetical protein
VRPARLIVVCALLLPPAGCDLGSESEQGTAARTETPRTETEERTGTHSVEGVLIRDWLGALNNGDYGHAADFFAPGALIDQGVPYRLPDRKAARLWNSGLPCRAELIEVEDEGERVRATFRLRDGPGGSCAGRVKVRFAFRGGRFTEFLQLPAEQPVPDETV